MNKGTKIVLGVVGVAAVGTGVYFLVKAITKGNSAYGQTNAFTPPVVAPGVVTPAPTTTTPSAPTTTKPSGVDTLAFQKYVLEVEKDTSILGSYGADGLWGSRTQAAWDKYGAKYTAWLAAQAATQAGQTTTPTATKDQTKKTHSDQWYLSKADAIYTALEGWDDDEDAIKSVAMNLHTNADYYALQSAFGKKSYYGATYDLKSWMKADMYDWEINKYFNKPMAANGVTVKLQYS